MIGEKRIHVPVVSGDDRSDLFLQAGIGFVYRRQLFGRAASSLHRLRWIHHSHGTVVPKFVGPEKADRHDQGVGKNEILGHRVHKKGSIAAGGLKERSGIEKSARHEIQRYFIRVFRRGFL